MHFKTLISFFIIFILHDIAASLFKYSSSKHDVTKNLQSCIQNLYRSTAELEKFLLHEKCNKPDLKFTSDVRNKTYVFDFNFDFHKSGKFDIRYDFIKNEAVLSIEGYYFENKGWISENSHISYFTDHILLYFGPLVLESNASSVNVPQDKNGYLGERGLKEKLAEGLLKNSILKHTWNHIAEYISAQLKKFAADLGNNTRTIISTSNSPDFSLDDRKYYYMIPNASLMCFELRNIAIDGLTKFHLFKKSYEQSFYTLEMKNIRGEMILDYGSENETPMELSFAADSFFVRFDVGNPSINVEMRNYRGYRTTQNISLTDHQSTMIIRSIESAMASSLMPSMKVWRTIDEISTNYQMEDSAKELFIAMLKHSDLNTKKKALKKWIPFNDHLIATTEIPRSTERNRTESYHYRVSFRNVTININTNVSYPENLHCVLPNNFNITRKIKANPVITSFSSNNRTENDTGIVINFHVNFPFVSFSTNKLNRSDDCEFQLENNEEIDAIEDEEWWILKKKIDAALIPMAKEHMIMSIKQVICSPYNICKRSVKIIRDLFSTYIDKVLEKVSYVKK